MLPNKTRVHNTDFFIRVDCSIRVYINLYICYLVRLLEGKGQVITVKMDGRLNRLSRDNGLILLIFLIQGIQHACILAI